MTVVHVLLGQFGIVRVQTAPPIFIGAREISTGIIVHLKHAVIPLEAAARDVEDPHADPSGEVRELDQFGLLVFLHGQVKNVLI